MKKALLLALAPALLAYCNPTPNPYSDGQALYKTQCANCHMDNGEGLGLLIPPLANTAGFLGLVRDNLPCFIRYGIERNMRVNQKTYNEKMPGNPKLSDVEITNILNYIGHSWGNNEPVFQLEEVQSLLAKCEK